MNLTYHQLRQIKHLAVDFHIEYDATEFSELRINTVTGQPHFLTVGVADTGLSRLYFTHSGEDGDCDQFIIEGVTDAMQMVGVVAAAYENFGYNPVALLKAYNNKATDSLRLLEKDFAIKIVDNYARFIDIQDITGVALLDGQCEWSDIYFQYQGENAESFDFEVFEVDDVMEVLNEVADTYAQLISTPLEMLKHY